MSLQFSTSVRNAMLDVIESTIGTSAILRIKTGAPPANCAAADTGDVLVEYALASDWSGAASNGTKALSNVPLSEAAIDAGTAAHYRIYASDGTTCHEQGTVTISGGGGDLTVDNPVIANGQTVNITSFSKTMMGA